MKRVLESDKGKKVETDLTDEQALEIVKTLSSDFAQSLVEAAGGKHGLSHNRLVWLHALAIEERDRVVAVPQQPIPGGNFSRVVEMFQNTGLKRAAVVLKTISGIEIRISLAGANSRNAGCLYVAERGEGGKYFGRIDGAGVFHRVGERSQEIEDLLADFNADPLAVATAYGKETGRCCFCYKELTDDLSVAAGFGPVCSVKYGLSRGTRPKKSTPAPATPKKPIAQVRRQRNAWEDQVRAAFQANPRAFMPVDPSAYSDCPEVLYCDGEADIIQIDGVTYRYWKDSIQTVA